MPISTTQQFIMHKNVVFFWALLLAVVSAASSSSSSWSQLFASGSRNSHMLLWSIASPSRPATGEATIVMRTLLVEAQSRGIIALASANKPNSKQPRLVASGHWDGSIRVWSVDGGDGKRATLTHSLRGHLDNTSSNSVSGSGGVQALEFFDGARFLASGSRDNSIKIWDLESPANANEKRDACATLRVHTDAVSGLKWLGDGRLASSSWDRTVRVWSRRSACVWSSVALVGHVHWVTSLELVERSSGDGHWLASGSVDGSIRLWNVNNGECVRTLTSVHGVRALRTLPVLPSVGELLMASGSVDGKVRVWDVERGVCVRTLHGHTDMINALDVLRGGADQGEGEGEEEEGADWRLASASNDGTIRIWNLSSVGSGAAVSVTKTPADHGHGDCVFSLRAIA